MGGGCCWCLGFLFLERFFLYWCIIILLVFNCKCLTNYLLESSVKTTVNKSSKIIKCKLSFLCFRQLCNDLHFLWISKRKKDEKCTLFLFPPKKHYRKMELCIHNLLTLPHLHRVKQSSTSIPLDKTHYRAQLQLKRGQNTNVKNLYKALVLTVAAALSFLTDL